MILINMNNDYDQLLIRITAITNIILGLSWTPFTSVMEVNYEKNNNYRICNYSNNDRSKYYI